MTDIRPRRSKSKGPSPTQRSLAHMRGLGFYAEVVERYNPFSRTRHDLFGFGDLLCVHMETGDLALVQTTSASNVSARINKIATHENLSLVRKAGFSIFVHGWYKSKGRWIVRVEDVS